ncbi:hypothetical protein BV20DRAFT_1058315 [Pilatotrama ljubarskyi]|nr:hypothetical protein BV20DRAFT_1058315 [Pilatotrama ljubarskyi]
MLQSLARSAGASPVPPPDGTMGSLLIAVIVCAMFYGGEPRTTYSSPEPGLVGHRAANAITRPALAVVVSISQMYYYYTRYPRDPPHLKALVAAVWCTDTILISHTIYWYLVAQYDDPTSLGLLSSTIIPEVFFQAFTGLFVQSFFAARIWRLSGRKLYLVVPVVALITAEFSAAMVYAIKGLSFKTFLDLGKVKALSISINAFAAAGDVVIAAILCTILQFSKTGFETSDLLINRLIVFSVNTGLLTSICACMSLIAILALPDTFVYICFYFLIGRLYSNSLMATLNARKALRNHSGTRIHDTSLSLRDLRPRSATDAVNRTASAFPARVKREGAGTGGVAQSQHIAIRIDTTEESRRDGDMDSASAKYDSVADKQSAEV